jgi:hypothetical protein
MNNPSETVADAQMERLIANLNSLVDGEFAGTLLTACGRRSVPYLERFLLRGKPRTIALPRCRAARALGELGAYPQLISYLREYRTPNDAQVRFAEDAVRSAAARELVRWKTDEVFHVLLSATKQRATEGLIFALGEFARLETVPLLFELLGEDFCREEAKAALKKMPAATRDHALRLLRGPMKSRAEDPVALRRRRAVLQLLGEFGISSREWTDLREYLNAALEDADLAIAVGAMGLKAGPAADRDLIVEALYLVSHRVNWAQEAQIEALLDSCPAESYRSAIAIAQQRLAEGKRHNWLDPSWRILKHVLRNQLCEGRYGAV